MVSSRPPGGSRSARFILTNQILAAASDDRSAAATGPEEPPRMRLNQIKLSGFKSFAEPTTFQLPGQRVGVVGPNGCGKSNIMDAVRWVLGESKASELRGESMQDVIFNGSGQRKPASRASVELVFSNEDARAGGAWSRFAEIAVRRVLTRDGGSSYFINNQAVRRRDVQDVFLGTGLGPRAYDVSADPNSDRYGYGSDDLWFVKFDSSGRAQVYNDLGQFQYNANINEFAGHIGGNTIGVGTTGLFWENVANRTYWFGKNGVLFNANPGSSKFGEAINNKDAKLAFDVNSKAIKAESNQALIKAGAAKLQKEYGLSASKALGVASALNAWAIAGHERGKITSRDMDLTVKAVFGIEFKEALAAFRDFESGDNTAARELTNRSANALGLKPDQAKEFIKGMYKSTLNKMGVNAADINW